MKRTKYGGRQKGTPNKSTAEIKELLTEFLHKEFENIDKTFQSAPPSERLRFLSSIIQFAIPKLKEVEATATIDAGNSPIIFEFNS